MSDLAERIQGARPRIEPDFTLEREERVRRALLAGVATRARQERRTRIAAVSMLGTLILLLGVFIGRQPARPPVAQLTEQRQVASLAELQDGSSVTARSNDARVEAVEVSPQSVTLRLETGSARFSVTPNPARPFHVLAGDVTITVLGTVFTVTLERTGVRVAVERGRVRVSNAAISRELGVGESTLVPPAPAAELPSAVAPIPQAPNDPARTAAVPHSWRALAEEGNYSAALTRLNAEGANAVRNTPEDLLLAADVARLGGRPERAVAPLQRLIREHAFDSRAPLAAFTLGRTLLEQLGRPREAAQAFSTARRLDRARALTQDALAREVECWSRAGEAALARERALEYLKLYPNGRRAGAVRRLGGIE
ncbi:MAG TPA: FecR domain-containing protein [Polyangiaceae bacterium]